MLDFPPLCANCGQAAPNRIAYAKAFTRAHSDAPTEHVVTHVQVPFCAACIARHNEQAHVPTTLARVVSSFAPAEMFGAVFPALAAAFCQWDMHSASSRAERRDADRQMWVIGAIVAAIALLAWVIG